MVSFYTFISHLNVLLFGLSSWLLVNSVWVELALLVEKAPEGYALASHMAIALQCANIFPLIYSLLARWKDPPIPYHISVGVILATGIVACELLAAHWDYVAVVFGAPRSVALLGLLFLGGALDCTSSVVYWPFVSEFEEAYTATLATGESLSGSVPALVGAWQLPLAAAPLFPPRLFFHLMTGLMGVSSLAFLLLFLPALRPPLAATHQPRLLQTVSDLSDKVTDEDDFGGGSEGGERAGDLEDVAVDVGLGRREERGGSRKRGWKGGGSGEGEGGAGEEGEEEEEGGGAGGEWGSQEEWRLLWSQSREAVWLEGWLKLVVDGLAPSLLPFACKPFPHPLPLLLATTLASNLLRPLGAHLATHAGLRSRRVGRVCAVWSMLYAAVLAAPFLPDNHPLRPHSFLLLLGVGSGALVAGYAHALLFIELAQRCHEAGQPPQARTAAYRWAGQSTQAGALCGTLAAFLLVNASPVFQP